MRLPVVAGFDRPTTAHLPQPRIPTKVRPRSASRRSTRRRQRGGHGSRARWLAVARRRIRTTTASLTDAAQHLSRPSQSGLLLPSVRVNQSINRVLRHHLGVIESLAWLRGLYRPWSSHSKNGRRYKLVSGLIFKFRAQVHVLSCCLAVFVGPKARDSTRNLGALTRSIDPPIN